VEFVERGVRLAAPGEIDKGNATPLVSEKVSHKAFPVLLAAIALCACGSSSDSGTKTSSGGSGGTLPSDGSAGGGGADASLGGGGASPAGGGGAGGGAGGASGSGGLGGAGGGVAGSGGSSGLDWWPGHYVLLLGGSANERDTLLASATIAPFTGIQIKYTWPQFEAAKDDYSAGFAKLDSDLAAMAAAGKKLLVMLMYKEFSAANAVPGYLLQSGPWCVTANGTTTCGQYEMNNGRTAMIWQGKGSGGVADRLAAWVAAIGAHVAAGAHADSIAGIVLPETACSEGSVPFADVGYTQASYLAALEDDALHLTQAFPTKPVFQYANFLPPNNNALSYLTQFADWALLHPHVGLGCPDVATTISPPAYDILKSASYQGRLPFDVAVETPDFQPARTPSLQATYDVATVAAPSGMGAQMVTWANVKNATGNVFTIADVATYIGSNPFPNTKPPTW
jgi:hypothetical protein